MPNATAWGGSPASVNANLLRLARLVRVRPHAQAKESVKTKEAIESAAARPMGEKNSKNLRSKRTRLAFRHTDFGIPSTIQPRYPGIVSALLFALPHLRSSPGGDLALSRLYRFIARQVGTSRPKRWAAESRTTSSSLIDDPERAGTRFWDHDSLIETRASEQASYVQDLHCSCILCCQRHAWVSKEVVAVRPSQSTPESRTRR